MCAMGYRRIHDLLRREGCRHGQNKTRRIYRELGLQLRNKTPKRWVKAKLRDDCKPATRSNAIWAMDFVHDQLATGRKLRVLTIVDTFSRFSPATEVRFNFREADVVEVLERVGRPESGHPIPFAGLIFAPTVGAPARRKERKFCGGEPRSCSVDGQTCP